MTWSAALGASLLIVLARPALWVMALAGFLVRGGILLFLLPIVALPSPVGLANVVAPTITSLVFSGPTTEFIVLVAVLGVITALVFFAATWAAAVAERALILAVASDEELPDGIRVAAHPRARAWRLVGVRLAVQLPLWVVLALASPRIVEITYRELTLPSDVVTPIAVRVLRAVPELIGGVAVAWVGGEIVGAIAARRIVLRGESIGRALRGALVDFVLRPLGPTGAFVVTTSALLLTVVPIVAAAGLAFGGVRTALGTGGQGQALGALVALALFITVWAAGLVVAGLLAAWRSAALTLEVLRIGGTFGAPSDHRSGDWDGRGASGTL
jgi:hypothetical protein